eukprot:TRINITY_DN1127_c0_g1_i16.p1 TRINITY_DN1127_c0_g1~~TRINITY_DN1127_c0_g1_i16.p1  ORF type:complete len:481 (+),score=165.40 TRINITY_DN1127_c0_g1_i16:73-1515(+)
MCIRDSEDLVYALIEIINKFRDSIKPYAIELIKELLKICNAIQERAKEKDGGYENQESKMKEAACIDAFGVILEVIGHNQSMLQQIEPLLLPVIRNSFDPEENYSMSSAVDLLSALTYYTHKTSPRLWEFFPLVVSITVGMPEEVAANEAIKQGGSWAYESLKDLITSVQNLVTRDPEGFLSGSSANGTHVELMFTLINRIIEISKSREHEAESVLAIKLILSMLEALKGRLGLYFATIMRIILNELSMAKKSVYRKILIQALVMCYWNSLENTLSILEAVGTTEATLAMILDESETFTKNFEIRRLLYGLTTLIEESYILPLHIKNKLPDVYKTLASLAARQVEISDKEESSSCDSDLPSYEYMGEASMDKVCEEIKVNETVEVAVGERKRGRNKQQEKLAADAKFYYNPLASVNELYYIKTKLAEFAKKQEKLFKELEKSLTEKEKEQLSNALTRANGYQKQAKKKNGKSTVGVNKAK